MPRGVESRVYSRYEGGRKYISDDDGWIDVILSVLTSGMFASAFKVNNSLTISAYPPRAAQYKAVPSNSPLSLISKLLTWYCTSTRLPLSAAI